MGRARRNEIDPQAFCVHRNKMEQEKDDLESVVGEGYEGYGAKARDGNGPREV